MYIKYVCIYKKIYRHNDKGSGSSIGAMLSRKIQDPLTLLCPFPKCLLTDKEARRFD